MNEVLLVGALARQLYSDRVAGRAGEDHVDPTCLRPRIELDGRAIVDGDVSGRLNRSAGHRRARHVDGYLHRILRIRGSSDRDDREYQHCCPEIPANIRLRDHLFLLLEFS